MLSVLLLIASLHMLPLQVAGCDAIVTVSPSSGPVGTVVTLTGRGFSAACKLIPGDNGGGLILQSAGGDATFGYAPVADPGRNPPIAPNGSFALRYPIPPTLYPFHGVGGGPTRPGTYYFHTQPPLPAEPTNRASLAATFTVTSLPAKLPATGGQGGHGGAVAAALAGAMIILGGVAMRWMQRERAPRGPD